MADKTINELTAATTMGNDDLLVLQQGGTAKKLSGKQLGDYVYNAAAEKVAEVNKAVDDARSSINDIVESVQSMTELGTDTTLTTSGMAADAKAAGDKIKGVEAASMAVLSQGNASGSIVTITDGADNIPIKKMTVNIRPVQEGTGDPSPDNIRPISGRTGVKVSRTGKNLWGGKQLRDDIKAAIPAATIDESLKTVRFNSNTADGKIFCKGPFKENTQYTLLLYGRNTASSATDVNFRVKYTDGTSNHNIKFNTAGTDSYAVFVSAVNKTIKDIEGVFKQGTTLIYYDQSGVFEGVLTAEDFEPYQGETYDIAFPSEAGIVCSGSLDINEDGSGILTVNRIAVSLGERNWGVGSVSNSTLFCSFGGINRNATILCDVYSYYGKVAMSGDVTRNNSIYNFSGYNGFGVRDDRFDVSTQEGIDAFKDYLEDKVACVAVSSPRIYEITSAQVTTLFGTNHIWADTGDITEFVYRKAPINSSDIDEKIAEIEPIIAGRETAMTATKNYSSRGLVLVDHTLYKLDTNVASGETLTPGVNCHMTTVEAEIAECVPNYRTVNGNDLSFDITLSAEDIPYNDSLSEHTSGSVGEAVSDLKESINNTIVERLDGTVPVDTSDIKNAFISNDLRLNNGAGTAITFKSSSATKTLNRFCKVEANAEYELTITEGNVLSNDNTRRVVLTDNNNLISKQLLYNTNAAQNDIITFKAEIDGYLCIGVDSNFASVSIRRKSITDNPLSQSMITTLGEMFKVTAYAQDATSQYNAFRKAFSIPLHPLVNGVAITTGGDKYTVTNGNHVKLELVEEPSGIPVLVNLLDISKNDGKDRNSGVVNNLPLAFSIPALSEVVYSFKNVSGITQNIFYGSSDEDIYYSSNLRLVNSSTSVLPKGATVTAGTLCADNCYGINHNFSGADIGSILLYLPKVKSACTIEFDVELLVNGDRYV